MSGESGWDDLSKSSSGERAYSLSRFLGKTLSATLAPVGLSEISSELIDLLVADPAVKRRDRFISDLERRIRSLEEDGSLSISDLENNEEVAALLFRSIQVAMHSSGQKKLLAVREAAINGIISAAGQNANPAQMIVNLIDQMTEYHIILLVWENSARQSYTVAQVRDEGGEEARRACFYGQSVFTDPSKLNFPVCIYDWGDLRLYVEQSDYTAFKIAHTGLVAMGLLRPVLRKESYTVDRVVERRTTPEIAGYEVSDLGKFVYSFITSASAP